MTFKEFKLLAENYNIIPITEIITADLLTPVLAFLKIRDNATDPFLLESVEGIGRLARYSFIGKNPYKKISNRGLKLEIQTESKTETLEKNIFSYLDSIIRSFNPAPINEIPYFNGGIVGYIGYENISLIEPVIDFKGNDELNIPDSILGFYDTIIAFDHFKHQIILIVNSIVDQKTELEEKFNTAKNKILELKSELNSSLSISLDFKVENPSTSENDNTTFFDLVDRCKKNIVEGDVFQIVLSRRFNSKYDGDLLNVYRALRIINPSPYMYFIEFADEISIIGTSPEDLLQVKERKATILPIAGTRRRGKTEEEDLLLEKDLLSDPKELAEHMMLVDLARNDLGRVCKYGSIEVTENMKINRFSHVMHIVSRVEGILKENCSAIDALKASFPAGTVTGAPKIRAIQLLDNYENLKRNVYAGAVGYIDFKGNLDLCISIRTFFAVKNNLYWQAGAGIVADSQPKLEQKEIKNKSAVLSQALKFAEVIDENISDR